MFTRSGLAVRWSNRHRLLLELAEACEVSTRWSCRAGVCHTSISPILSGTVDYARDHSDMSASDHFLISCARPRDDVVLDP
jgi:hypothetical protein